MTTASLFAPYAHVFQSMRSLRGDLDATLDPTTGFAPSLRDACQKALNAAESRDRDVNFDTDDVESLRLERNTWDLLQHLYGARKTDVSTIPTAPDILSENLYATPRMLANHLIQHSSTLTEMIITREWLQDTAPPPKILETAPAYRNFTRVKLLHAQRSGTMDAQTQAVKELDPDATNREPGGVLDIEDALYEKALAHSLYTYIRAGQSEQAMELCRAARRPWQAAALQGYMLFDWSGISRSIAGEDDAMDQDPIVEISGNKRRRLWKASCTAAALNGKLTAQDRVLFAALAASPQTLGVLTKDACKTWEDHLWARVSALCEEKLSEDMRRLGKNFWEEGTKAFETAPIENMETESVSLEEARRVLGKMVDLKVDEGPGADDPFHITQLRIILDQADSLLEDFAVYLGSQNLPPSAPEYPRLARFFAHLCLFLDHIEMPVSPMASQRILEAYVGVLQERGQADLVAQYAAALGDNAVSRYALFLAELPVSATRQQRRDALLRAREYGLDLNQVAISAADLSTERAFKVLPDLSVPYPPVLSDPRELSDPEQALINSIDWLSFQESTYRDAVVRSNSVMRYFLGCGNLHACNILRERRPVSLRDDPPGNPSDRYEHLHYERFFVAWAALGLADHRGSQLLRPEINPLSRGKEVDMYQSSLNKARELVIQLLTHGWLQADELGGTKEPRRELELARVREMYIPEIIIRLHRVLYDSRALFPQNIKAALVLANVVADSRYEIYDAFDNPYGNRLGEYLQCIKAAILGGLEGGGSDPFRIVSAS